MNKKLIFLFVFNFLILVVFAQKQKHKLDLGIRAGLGISSAPNKSYPENINQVKDLSSFTAGLSIGYKINNYFSLNGLMLYETKVEPIFSLINDPALNMGRAKVKNNYTTFHLSARGTYGDKFKVYLEAGPYAGYLINTVLKTAAFTSDVTNNINQIDYGISAGAGFIHDLNKRTNLNLSVRRSISFYDTPQNSTSDFRLNMIQILCGINYNL